MQLWDFIGLRYQISYSFRSYIWSNNIWIPSLWSLKLGVTRNSLFLSRISTVLLCGGFCLWLGGSLEDPRPASLKGRKYQRFKLTEKLKLCLGRRPIVWIRPMSEMGFLFFLGLCGDNWDSYWGKCILKDFSIGSAIQWLIWLLRFFCFIQEC